MESNPTYDDTDCYETMAQCRIETDFTKDQPASLPSGNTNLYESVSQGRFETDLNTTASISSVNNNYYNRVSQDNIEVRDKTASVLDGTKYYDISSQGRIQADSDQPAHIHSWDVYDRVSPRTSKRSSVSRTNKKWITCLTFVVILQTLCLVVLFALAGYSHLQSNQLSQQLSSSLEQKTHPLNMELNETIERSQIETETSLKSFLHFSVQTLNTSTISQLNNLKSSVRTLNTSTMDQLNNLQSSVSTLNLTTIGQLNSLQFSVNTQYSTATDQLSNLQSSVNRLTNSPVDLYQGCTKLTKTCTASTGQEGHIWSGCVTSPGQHIDPTVS